jgi:twitching motility protein PilT
MNLLIAEQLRQCKEATGGNFSDVQAREQDHFRIRTTKGIEPVEGPIITKGDIFDFLQRTCPHLRFEEELERHQGEYDFGLEFDGDIYRANLAYYHGKQWIKLVMRKLDEHIRTLTQLGLPESLLKWLEPEAGLIFVVGPTGSGKTSTLASLVEHLNQQRSIHILTIEDPIEFVHEQKLATITQRQVAQDTKDFASAARNALREDPDVILIGEIRDLDSAREAFRLAETGHLVLASLHADSAVGAIDRVAKLVEGAAEQRMLLHSLASNLIGVLYQRLIVSKRKDRVGLPLRTAVYEMISNTSAVANHIRENKIVQIPTAIQFSGAAENQIPFEQVVKALLKSGQIDELTATAALRSHDRSRALENREVVA